ncbi:MAG: hypothetical protein WDO24_09420 [Pseudomonadota bacterium]
MFDQSVFAPAPERASANQVWRSERILSAARLVLLALPWLWAIGYFFPPLNHDVGALLQFAQRMLQGEVLYVDLIDINPPMVFLLDTVPVAIAAALKLPVVTCFTLFVLALCAITLAWCVRLLARRDDRGALGALLWPALIGFALIVYPMHSFGQREHLLLVFALPYALAAAARADRAATSQPLGRGLEIAIALYALLGILLKPYFALVPLALELIVLGHVGIARWARSPQPRLILLGCVAYVGAVWLWLPDYFRVIVPLVAQCYEHIDLASLAGLLIQDQVPALLLPLAPLAAIAFRMPGAGLSRAMVGLVLAGTASGILQGKGWDYQFFTARAALLLLIGALVVDGFGRLAPQLRRGAALMVAAVVCAGMFAFTGVLNPPFKGPRNFVNTAASRLLPVVQANAAGQPVLWLTTSIYPQFPVLNYTDSRLAMPFMSLWVLPAVYGPEDAPGGAMVYRAPAAMSRAEQLVYRGVVAGFTCEHPALVLVEQASREGGFHGLPFDYLDYFGRDPGFAAEWAHYALLTKIDNISIYRRQP